MTDTDTYIRRLAESNPLREPTLRLAIQALRLPSGSRGLDVGCGIGLQALPLAEAVGSAGHVTGLDQSPEFLLYADEIVKKSGLAQRISFRQGDMSQLPFDDDAFDWVWSADCVGYPVGEVLPLLVVRPGGSVAILAWSSQQLLPGYPLLEARLNGTCSGFAPFVKGKRPESPDFILNLPDYYAFFTYSMFRGKVSK